MAHYKGLIKSNGEYVATDKQEKKNFKKHQAISKLLDIDLKCPYCEEILEKANDT